MDRNMMLTPDEYMAIMRLISSEKESEGSELAQVDKPASRRKSSAYQRRYKAAFKKIAPQYKLKSGRWKKNGFRMAVREAHKMAKK
jgi:hypothetical protein